MSFINLSQSYIKSTNPSILRRVRMSFVPDLYWTSSLSEIELGFRNNPPRKKAFGFKSAHVLIDKLRVRRLWPDSFDEDDGVSFEGMNQGFCFPNFELSDQTSWRLASWMAGNSVEYLAAQRKFGFNRERFVKIPRMVLKYEACGDRGSLSIQRMDDRQSEKKKNLGSRLDLLRKRFAHLIPKSPQSPLPQPAN